MTTKGENGRVLRFFVASLTLFSGAVYATADLDLDFGTGGKVITDISGRFDEARALVIQADGRIVAAGVTGTGSSQDFALVRYNTDGALDRSFGVEGTVITDVSRGRGDAVWALAVQEDGKLLAAGVADGDFALARYNTDGSLDTQFGNAGTITTDFGGDDRAHALALQSDGQIVVAGFADRLDFALARYGVDGRLDAQFGNEGKVITSFSNQPDTAFALAIQSDGRIVAAGATRGFPSAQYALARYNTNGSLDKDFGAVGIVTIDFDRDARAHALAIQWDGKILTGGFVNNGSSGDAAFTRHNANGTLDRTFGIGGRLLTDFGGRNFGNALAIQSDGRFVVAGADDFPPYYDFALARYQSDGSRDLTFSRDGTVLTEFGGNSWINAIAVQSDGRIIAAGYVRQPSGADFALVRYASGAP
ncbi:MAG TPA: delta-60 repeat domain-containing protein [Gemmatimonadaceae bacterium]|nr:delta-60 repeat domain-containing protein [Gemmatimonadaceae bacterium]